MPRSKIIKDPIEHAQRLSFVRSRCQARYRDEIWRMNFGQFKRLWAKHWHLRGRGSKDLVMTRIDPEQAWDIHNCALITREASIRFHNYYRMGQYRAEVFEDAITYG